MKKIVRLTESDLNRIVKRIIKEQDEITAVEEIISNPSVERAAAEVISQMSPKDIRNIKNTFNNLGVSPNSSFGEIKNAVENVVEDMETSTEMTEDEKMSPKKRLWENVKMGLATIGIINAGLFFTPFSMLIDKMMDLDPSNQESMQVSFIISALLLLMNHELFLKGDNDKKGLKEQQEDERVMSLSQQLSRVDDYITDNGKQKPEGDYALIHRVLKAAYDQKFHPSVLIDYLYKNLRKPSFE